MRSSKPGTCSAIAARGKTARSSKRYVRVTDRYLAGTPELIPLTLSHEDRPPGRSSFSGTPKPGVAALLIQPWDVDAMWGVVRPHLEKALARQSEFRAEDIRQMCAGNVMQL